MLSLIHIFLLLFFLLWGEVLETGVQQVAGAVAMDSRDSDGIPQSQVVELIKVRVRDTGCLLYTSLYTQ